MDYIETFFSLSLQGILTCLALQNSPVNDGKKILKKEPYSQLLWKTNNAIWRICPTVFCWTSSEY